MSSPLAHLDLLLPSGAHLLVWTAEGDVQMSRSEDGRRHFLFAEPGISVLLAGVPAGAKDAESLQDWFLAHPALRPRWARTVGMEVEMGAALSANELPDAFWQHESSLPLQSLRPLIVEESSSAVAIEEFNSIVAVEEEEQRAPVSETEAPASAPAKMGRSEERAAEILSAPAEASEPARDPVLSLAGSPTERLAALPVRGATPKIERRPRESRIYADPSSAFVLVQMPSGEDFDLGEWLGEESSRAPAGYMVDEEGDAVLSSAVLAELLLTGPGPEPLSRKREVAWEILRSYERRLEMELRQGATAAAELRARVEEEQKAPTAILGTSGVLYGKLGETNDDASAEAAGEVAPEAPSHVLRVAIPGSEKNAWFAPVGGSYRIGAPDERGRNTICVKILPSGLLIPLGTSGGERLWAQGERLTVVPAVPRVAPQQEVTSARSSKASFVAEASSSNENSRSAPRSQPAEVAVSVPSKTAVSVAAPREQEVPGESPDYNNSNNNYSLDDSDLPPYIPSDEYPPMQDYDPMEDLLDAPFPRVEQEHSSPPPAHHFEIPLPDEDSLPPLDDEPVYFEDESSSRAPSQGPPRGGGAPRGGKGRNNNGNNSRPAPKAAGRNRDDESRSSSNSNKGPVGNVRWHLPDEGQTNVENWKQRSPRGELWVSELLDALVDSPAELDAMGCLVPIRLLRAGHQISRSDKELFDEVVHNALQARLAQVRVYEIDGRSYFARPAGDKIRLIGPKGVLVRTERVRDAVAQSYGLDPRNCFVEPEERGVPVAERSGVRRSGR